MPKADESSAATGVSGMEDDPSRALESRRGNAVDARGETADSNSGGQSGEFPKVMVLVITYNVEAWIGDLLETLGKQDYGSFTVCIVDDASSDRTVERAQISCRSNQWVISNATNRGRCATIDSLIPFHPQYKYVVLVNAAALPNPSFLSNLVNFAESIGESFGGATPRILDRETMEPYVALPTRGITNFLRSSVLGLGRRNDLPKDSQPSFEVNSFWGCACILSAKMVDDFRFDEKLWIFGEEEDLAVRAARAGYKFYWTNVTSIPYKAGASTTDERGVTPTRMYYGLRNRVYLALKYYGLFEAIVVILAGTVYSCFVSLKRPALFYQILRAMAWNAVRMGCTLNEREMWHSPSAVT